MLALVPRSVLRYQDLDLMESRLILDHRLACKSARSSKQRIHFKEISPPR